MRRRDAVKLEPGTRVLFGDAWCWPKIRRVGRGTVRHVSERGGIFVDNDDGRFHSVPYHHIKRVFA